MQHGVQVALERFFFASLLLQTQHHSAFSKLKVGGENTHFKRSQISKSSHLGETATTLVDNSPAF